MLVETKAKVGVFAIALGAYLPQFPTLVPEFEAQYDEMLTWQRKSMSGAGQPRYAEDSVTPILPRSEDHIRE